METTEKTKVDELAVLLCKHKPRLSLVFYNTKHKVDENARSLKRMSFRAEGLHGDMDQSRRDSIMMRFRTKTLSVLVATDIAARGLDISGVDMVFNYDVPKNADHYVHRIGRTGRAGNVGKAITLVLGKEAKQMKRIQRHTNVEMGKETAKVPVVVKPEVAAAPVLRYLLLSIK